MCKLRTQQTLYQINENRNKKQIADMYFLIKIVSFNVIL